MFSTTVNRPTGYYSTFAVRLPPSTQQQQRTLKRKTMDNTSNILAIPPHPPLPHGVSGIFHSVEDHHNHHNRYPNNKQQMQEASNNNAQHHQRHDSANSFASNERQFKRPRCESFSSNLSKSSTPPTTIATKKRTNSIASSSGSSNGSGDRKYMCDWDGCGQAFDRIEHLNRHKRRHTGEKPYRCLISQCSKLFSRFDNMMQHVGIHSIEGSKTEIPNIKNLSVKGNGRGRARRTSYRGSQDPYEKFRRHVEGTLGQALAECCILPTENPDFSNLTLRPLLNNADGKDMSSSKATPSSKVPATIDEDTPLQNVFRNDMFVQPPQPTTKNRPRLDSLMDEAEHHHKKAIQQQQQSMAAISRRDSMSPSRIPYQYYHSQQPNSLFRSSALFGQHRSSYPPPPATSSSTISYQHRGSISAYQPPSSSIQYSNVRGSHHHDQKQ